jgi:hypothetical protein
MAPLRFLLRPSGKQFRTFLNEIVAAGKRACAAQTAKAAIFQQHDEGLRRRDLIDRNLGKGPAGWKLDGVGRMGAADRTLPGACAKCILDDPVDGACAAAAFNAAAEAAIDLPCRARPFGRSAHRAADVVIAQHIAGTDDQGIFRCDAASWIVKPQPRGKAKRFNFKVFQTAVVKLGPLWNKSKQAILPALLAGSQTVLPLQQRFAGH